MIRSRFPRTAGCAQVGLCATVYSATGANSFALAGNTKSFASFVSSRNAFPVVDEKDELVGIIHMDNIRGIIFNPDRHEGTVVSGLMTKPAAVINLNENLHAVLKKFDDTNQWNLPVVEGNKYVGFVSKSSVLTKYRSELLKTI